MSRQTMVSIAASVIVGVALVATVSTDALAKKAKPRAVAVVAAPVAVAVIGNNYGPVADRVPKCFDSAIYYPVPPCY